MSAGLINIRPEMNRATRHRPTSLARVPRVTVVIPVYNYGHFLRECVESVHQQEGVDVNIVIVDDASTDDSLEVARRLALESEERAAFPIRVDVNAHNKGMVPTINDALWEVETDYLVKLDADDLLPAGALARATALLEAHPSVGFVYGFPVVFTESPPPSPCTSVRSWSVWSGRDWIERLCHKGGGTIYQPEVVMRTSVLHRAGKYEPSLPHGSDFEMWLRMAAIADVGRVNGAHQGFYRLHPGSMQRTVNAGHVTDLLAHRSSFENVLDGYAADLPDAERLLALARRSVAVNALDKTCRAYDGGTAAEEPVGEYVAIALDTFPDSWKLRQWRSAERRRRVGADRAARTRVAAIGRVRRDIEDRLRWRRWRWTGL
jgi:glycosyltransferase involved in cell wall biosynthesis